MVQGGCFQQNLRNAICNENAQVKRGGSTELLCQPFNQCCSRISQFKGDRIQIRVQRGACPIILSLPLYPDIRLAVLSLNHGQYRQSRKKLDFNTKIVAHFNTFNQNFLF